MTELILKATLSMVLCLAFVALARRARASMRHAVLTSMFILLLLLPFAAMKSPLPKKEVRVDVPQIAQQVVAPAPADPIAATPVKPSFDFIRAAKIAYGGVAAILLLSLAAGLWRLHHWAQRGEVWPDGVRLASELANESGIRRATLVVLSEDAATPMTFGFRKQTIVLPAAAKTWSADELNRALRHELEHVERDDWAVQLMARIATAVYWPHPLVWVALRRFLVEAERACDDAVVRSFEPSSYAEQLVNLARSLTSRTNVPVLAMAAPTRLSERIHAILDRTQVRGRQSRLASGLTIVVTAMTLILFASVTVVANAAAAAGVNDAVADGVREGVSGALSEDDDDSLGEAVVHAAEKGDVRVLRLFLDDGVPIDKSFEGDGTMLLVAAKHGHIEAVRFLISRGADVNAPSPGDGNPLIAAAQSGEYEIARLLVDRGARVNEFVMGDETPLIAASESGSVDIARLLLERGADPNLGAWSDERHREWRTPLNMARRYRNKDVETLLLSAGAKK